MQHTGRYIFEILTNRFRPQFNETIKSLQFHTLNRQNGENAEEWIGRLWLSAIECTYKELDGQSKEQFSHGLNDSDMFGEIIRELKIHENMETTSTNRIGLGTTLLQTRDGRTCPRDTAPDNTILRPITFASKSLTSAE